MEFINYVSPPMDPKLRDKVMGEFREGATKVLGIPIGTVGPTSVRPKFATTAFRARLVGTPEHDHEEHEEVDVLGFQGSRGGHSAERVVRRR